ncbi:AAA family ATPase [Acinetobacter baumannii]|uniref:AAA family ATPase n=1 Tax=Acinetobacter baumannii TaxID=470 RepID=A0ABD5DCB1_ACIBA|nr:AAA family ATPase [Acinetobacter baumannii]EHU2760856.1 AAA family ATPase [Acinetobacter baumannii]EJB8490025.1 AAA family ATPase [Acinetobacter baumannii]EKV7389824.1 AAA family ATPase [Acinetobacter baumannii]EKW3202878.1 AAA family ATPase [Acinetobacter baumannii]EKX0107456.1 AAA family ATPase [Acinetobacter baumannii]
MTDQVNDNLFLVCGFPASGKSTSLRNLENVIYLNCEPGRKLPFRPKKFKQFVITDPYQVHEAFEWAETQPDYHTIVVDGLNFLMDMFETNYIIGASDTRAEWSNYAQFFKKLMQTYVAASTKNVIFTAHLKSEYNENTMLMETKVPVKGSLANQGLEAYFSTILYTKKVKLTELEKQGQSSMLLNITDEERALGYKHVFQTKVTADTTHERMRGPMGLWDNNELFIDNDCAFVLERLREYYGEDDLAA